MNKLVSGLLIASLALGGVTLANADSDYRGKGEHHGGKYCDKGKHGKRYEHGSRVERMAKELGLNETQLKQVREIRDKFKPERQVLREKMRVTRKEMRNLRQADKMDEAAIDKAVAAQAEVMKKKIMLRGKMYAEINQVLTSEQRAKMKDMRERHGKADHHERRGRDD